MKLLNLSKVPLTTIRVLPSRHGIVATNETDNSFSFTLKTATQYSIEVGSAGYKNGLLLFANPLETDVPTLDSKWKVLTNATADDVKNLSGYTGIYFNPGVHDIDLFQAPSNIKNIYIPGDAWVYGAIKLDGNQNKDVKIYGRGALSGARFALRQHHSIEATNGADNLTVNGITIPDFKHFCLRAITSNNHINWVKIVGGWAFNNDGIAVYNNSTIKNCFIWANDDNIKLYRDNISVENCVCWQLDNGAIFQLGWSAVQASNVNVKNVDIVRAEWRSYRTNNGVISAVIDPSNNINTQSNWVIENITVENPVTHIFRLAPKSPHFIKDMLFKNWDVKMDFSQNKYNYIQGKDVDHKISNLTIENLKINGTLITNDNAVSYGKFKLLNTNNVNFTSGVIDNMVEITLTSPTNANEYMVGDEITLTCNLDKDVNGKVVYSINNDKVESTTKPDYIAKYTFVKSGLYTLSASFIDEDGNVFKSHEITAKVNAQMGKLPGKIEAEDYTNMQGIQTELSSDNTGNENIGFIENGDWVTYRVKQDLLVNPATDIVAFFRVAAAKQSGTIDIMMDDAKVGELTVPVTGGWQTWETVSTSLQIPQQLPDTVTLKLAFLGGSGFLFNINFFEISQSVGFNQIDYSNTQIRSNSTQKSAIITHSGAINNVKVYALNGKQIVNINPNTHNKYIVNLQHVLPGAYIVTLNNGFSQQIVITY